MDYPLDYALLKEKGRKIIDEKISLAKEKYIPDIVNCKTHDEYKNTLNEDDYEQLMYEYYECRCNEPLDDYVRDMTDSDRRKILDDIYMKMDIEDFTVCLNALDDMDKWYIKSYIILIISVQRV